MSRFLDWLSRLATAKPIVTLAVLAAVTAGVGAGFTRLGPQAESSVFLPADSRVAVASEKIEAQFAGSRDTVAATLIFRGPALTPAGLDQIDRAVREVESNALVEPLLAGRVVSPALPLAAALGRDDFASLSQQQIDEAAAGNPALDRLVGRDSDGAPVAIATVRLLDRAKAVELAAEAAGEAGDGEEADRLAAEAETLAGTLAEAELAIRDIARSSGGPLDAGSLSPAVTAEESSGATGSEMLLLMVIALGVIAALLLLFTRSVLDLALSLLGLVVTIVWVVGAQGWLGPNGAGLIGLPNTLTTMVPLMLIGLVVDYAIQSVGWYREQRNEGHEVRVAARRGLRAVIIPLGLAAVTTVVSFFSNLSSPIPANGDFGVVAGLGVAFGLIVMLPLIFAARALADRRREARGSLRPARPIVGAIPGVGAAAEVLGGRIARRPAPFLVAIGVITVLLGIASTRIETVFDTRAFLPSGGEAIEHVETLDEAFGGSTEDVTMLIEAEITDDRTIRNVIDLTIAFSDDLRRPEGVVGDIKSSLGLLLLDWIHDDGTAADNYDPELRALAEAANEFRLDPAQVQALLDRLEVIDPEEFRHVAVNNPDGVDTLLIRFEALAGDQERTERMVADVSGLWFGQADEFTSTSSGIVSLEVVNAMTSSQTSSIVTTILSALIILVIFFWITQRRAALGFIAVGPIVLVLIWVLGTMALLGIPYNVITALITALSIGIGVDYTIHIIHRYQEEFADLREPEAAARRTLATTGSALLGSAMTTALGFGVLVFSSLTPFQQFGVVTAITIAYALVAAVVVVPPMMIVWAAYQNHRLRSAVARAARELDDTP